MGRFFCFILAMTIDETEFLLLPACAWHLVVEMETQAPLKNGLPFCLCIRCNSFDAYICRNEVLSWKVGQVSCH